MGADLALSDLRRGVSRFAPLTKPVVCAPSEAHAVHFDGLAAWAAAQIDAGGLTGATVRDCILGSNRPAAIGGFDLPPENTKADVRPPATAAWALPRRRV
jgi:hypothetical protein